MLIIQLIRDYLNGEKMPERIRYGMMQDGYQYFRWDAEAEEYVCEADDKCFLSLVPWHHLRDFVEVAEQTEPQISPADCATCKHDLWSTPRTCGKCARQEDGKPSMYEPKIEPQTERELEQARDALKRMAVEKMAALADRLEQTERSE